MVITGQATLNKMGIFPPTLFVNEIDLLHGPNDYGGSPLITTTASRYNERAISDL